MKSKRLLIIALLFSSLHLPAQKQVLSGLIEQNHKWLYAYTFENAITINTNEKMWKMLQDDNLAPSGHNSFYILAEGLATLSDKFNETNLIAKCGTGVNLDDEQSNMPGCKAAIDSWKDKYKITNNAKNISATNNAYRLINGYATTLADLFNPSTSSLWFNTHKPKSQKQNYIINMDNKYKGVQTSWSSDGATFTINAPADTEVDEWDKKIENGFKSGWIKN